MTFPEIPAIDIDTGDGHGRRRGCVVALALQDEGGGGGRWDFDMKIPPRGCALVYVNEARERDRGNFLPLRSQFTGYSQVDALDVNRQYAACQATTMVCVQSEVWMRQ